MQVIFWKCMVFWILLIAAIPFWLCLIYFFNFEPNISWLRENIGTYLYIAAALPVLEEIVFRGFLQGQFVKRLGDRGLGVLSYANILTSMVFCAMHFFYHSPLWAALVLIPSLIFGYSKDKYKTLAAPIILHVFYNAGYFLIFGTSTH